MPGAKRMNMEFCANHPDRKANYVCFKHNISMCEECLSCRDPQIYCKFRTACPIHFLTKRKGGLDDDYRPAAQESAEKVSTG